MKIRKSELERIVVEETIKEMDRFLGGQIDIDPLSDEEQEASTDAYYELFDFLMDSELPGSKPSEKLKYALRWIAKFEGGKPSEPDSDATRNKINQFMRNAPGVKRSADGSRSLEEGVVDMDGETVITGPDGDASPEARGLARQEDLQATMLKAAMEIKNNMPQEAYETLLRALAAAGTDEKYLDDFMGYGDLEEYRSDGSTRSANTAPRPDSSTHKKKREARPSSDTSPNRNKYPGGR